MTQRTAQRSKPTQRRRYSLFAAMYRARFPPKEKPGAGDGVLLLVGKTLGPSPKVIAKVKPVSGIRSRMQSARPLTCGLAASFRRANQDAQDGSDSEQQAPERRPSPVLVRAEREPAEDEDEEDNEPDGNRGNYLRRCGVHACSPGSPRLRWHWTHRLVRRHRLGKPCVPRLVGVGVRLLPQIGRRACSCGKVPPSQRWSGSG